MSDFYLAISGLCCSLSLWHTDSLAVAHRLFLQRRRRRRRQDWSLPEDPPNHLHLQRRGSPQHTPPYPRPGGWARRVSFLPGHLRSSSITSLGTAWLGTSTSHTLSTITLLRVGHGDLCIESAKWAHGRQKWAEGSQPHVRPSAWATHRPRRVPEAHEACYLTCRVFFKRLPKFRAEKDIGSHPDSSF